MLSYVIILYNKFLQKDNDMKKIFTILVIISCTSLMAIDIAPITKKCAGCHGLKGEKKALNKSKIMNQMTKEEFITATKGYKDGSYGGAMKAIMKPQVMALSDEQIEALADFYIK